MMSNQKLQCERSLKDQAPCLSDYADVLILSSKFISAEFETIRQSLMLKEHATYAHVAQ